jgi:putative radical SAM enzyme (TIGR03279 family)
MTTTNATKGVVVARLDRLSPLYEAGLRRGDRIVAVDGNVVVDELDLRFFAAAQEFRLDAVRRGTAVSFGVTRSSGYTLGVEFRPAAIRRCANRCIFCFIDQMPPGLRSGLYIKDEDLSHSFINGNYVTLAGARRADLLKIARLGLSPLFISVHATDTALRRLMLGNRLAPDIGEQLLFLCENNIRLHTQIVVCPGFNDGPVLERTIRDLLSLRDGLLSIAVVPVGLTRFRRFPLQPVERSNAAAICSAVGRLSDRDRQRSGSRRVFLADEFLLKAGLPIPPAGYYEGYPQIENGVGLVRQLMDSWSSAKRGFRGQAAASGRSAPGKRYFLATSVSAFPYLKKIALEAGRLRPGVTLEATAILNRFFGESVTVAGLTCAADLLRAIAGAKLNGRIDGALLPAVMFNYAGFTLDGYSAARIERESGVKVTIIGTVEELLELR